MVWSTAAELRLEIGSSTEELSDGDATSWLQMANDKVVSQAGRENSIEVFTVRTNRAGTLIKELRLYFKPALSIDEVYQNEVLLTLTTDYTADTANSKVTLASGLAVNEGDEILINYTPQFLKRWEAKLAAWYIMSTRNMNTAGGTLDVKIARLTEEIASFEKIAADAPKISKYTDHNPARAGVDRWNP